MTAYYNEIDPYCCDWLSNLMDANLIAPGFIDNRSIEDVRPEELKKYVQCHFFAGIGVWSYALRRAGWRDDRPVWTGSCPCQPFSSAGKAGGFDDERHLWPALHHLIRQCRPPETFGEQVASKDGLAWLDLVQTDMEAEGYAFGAVDLCAAGVGAPHIRQRLFWVADAEFSGSAGETECGDSQAYSEGPAGGSGRYGEHRTAGGVADAGGERRQQDAGGSPCNEATDGGAGRYRGESHIDHLASGDGQVRIVADADAERQLAAAGGGTSVGKRDTEPCSLVGDALGTGLEGHPGHGHDGDGPGRQHEAEDRPVAAPGCTNGYWSDADWLPFRDGKIRPIEPGTQPLAYGTPSTVGRLRAYGNAIVAEVAVEFIRSYLEGVKA